MDRKETAADKEITMWIRLPSLPSEFHDLIWFKKIGNMVGNILKIHAHACDADRGIYARRCSSFLRQTSTLLCSSRTSYTMHSL